MPENVFQFFPPKFLPRNTELNLYGRDWSRQTGASDISCVVSSAAMSSTGWWLGTGGNELSQLSDQWVPNFEVDNNYALLIRGV